MNHLPGGGWGICAPALPEVLTTDARVHPTGNMDIWWAQKCIITNVKMCTSHPRPVIA
jgi:hypothetical protein